MSLINVTNLTFAYNGSYDNIFEYVSFQLDTDWKLGFIGRNGRGKTTFLHLLLGKYEYCGSISASVSFEYFPYEVADKESNTINVVDSICLDYLHWELMRELNLLDVSEDVLYRPFDTLSNGEQTKVLLVALFLKENRFLLIDEPTNHLDMKARKLVSDYLKSKQDFILVSQRVISIIFSSTQYASFHITLEFLGELDLSNIQILTNRLTKVAENSKSFKVDIGGLGGFSNIKRPHTLWTAIGRSLPELKKLRNELHNELANWGLVLEERKYKPYISLASRPKLEGIDLSEVLFKKLG